MSRQGPHGRQRSKRWRDMPPKAVRVFAPRAAGTFGKCPTPDKLTYPTREAAENFILHNGYARRAKTGRGLTPYHCPGGDHWHTTANRDWSE